MSLSSSPVPGTRPEAVTGCSVSFLLEALTAESLDWEADRDKVGVPSCCVDDMDAAFDNIDKNGGGIILFDEFCEWAINKSLDLLDDEELEGADFKAMKDALPEQGKKRVYLKLIHRRKLMVVKPDIWKTLEVKKYYAFQRI